MATYILDATFPRLLESAEVNAEELLRKAGLAEDLFSRDTPALSSADYLALMASLGSLCDPSVAVRLATQPGLEQFSPPIFASYCARNGLRFIERISKYKPLIAPVRYRLERLGTESTIYVDADRPELTLPAFMAEGELAFICHILRSATKTEITPISAETAHEPSTELRHYLGIEVVCSGVTALTFATKDLELPFVSFNDSMWSFFEPELRRRLSQLEIDDTQAARVRAALVELLPAGEATIEDVARKLATSARSLQRQLLAEETTFRSQLNHVRLLLAKQYLSFSDMSMDSIAFMLGYTQANSFVRAFTVWTGQTPQQFRADPAMELPGPAAGREGGPSNGRIWGHHGRKEHLETKAVVGDLP